jgi:hypothetical protein
VITFPSPASINIFGILAANIKTANLIYL